MNNKNLLLAGIIGPIIFFLIVYFISPILYPGYDSYTQPISQLGAENSPVKNLTNILGFNLFGILIIIFSIGVYKYSNTNNLTKLSAIFIFITGGLMFSVGIFSCDVNCQNSPFIDKTHTFSSNLQFPILAIAYILLFLEFGKDKKTRNISFLIATMGTASLVLGYFSMFYQVPIEYAGIIQRTAIGLPYVLMAIIAHLLYK